MNTPPANHASLSVTVNSQEKNTVNSIYYNDYIPNTITERKDLGTFSHFLRNQVTLQNYLKSEIYLAPIAIPCFVLALIFLVCGIVAYCRYATALRKEIRREDASRYEHCKRGGPVMFAVGFLVSFLVPFVGSGIVLACCRRYMARFGVVLALSILIFIGGIICIPLWNIGYGMGNPCLVVGVFLIEIVVFHFHRIFTVIDTAANL